MPSRETSRNPLDRRRYVQRPSPYNMPGPSSSQSRFPFASRLSKPPDAPLFYSATDYDDDGFHSPNDEQEHERDVADFYALQRSRQAFAASGLTESDELSDNGIEKVERDAEGQRHDRDESLPRGRSRSAAGSESSKGKGRLVDVNLASTVQEEDEPESLANLSPTDTDEPPPPFQTFQRPREERKSSFLPMETDEEAKLGMRPPSPDRESVPPTVILPSPEPPRHDAFWASLFQISLFALFAHSC